MFATTHFTEYCRWENETFKDFVFVEGMNPIELGKRLNDLAKRSNEADGKLHKEVITEFKDVFTQGSVPFFRPRPISATSSCHIYVKFSETALEEYELDLVRLTADLEQYLSDCQKEDCSSGNPFYKGGISNYLTQKCRYTLPIAPYVAFGKSNPFYVSIGNGRILHNFGENGAPVTAFSDENIPGVLLPIGTQIDTNRLIGDERFLKDEHELWDEAREAVSKGKDPFSVFLASRITDANTAKNIKIKKAEVMSAELGRPLCYVSPLINAIWRVDNDRTEETLSVLNGKMFKSHGKAFKMILSEYKNGEFYMRFLVEAPYSDIPFYSASEIFDVMTPMSKVNGTLKYYHLYNEEFREWIKDIRKESSFLHSLASGELQVLSDRGLFLNSYKTPIETITKYFIS